jgi:hypothetical protein
VAVLAAASLGLDWLLLSADFASLAGPSWIIRKITWIITARVCHKLPPFYVDKEIIFLAWWLVQLNLRLHWCAKGYFPGLWLGHQMA